jgi:pimeloyl-ACP methyl ester carboxylesterase
MAFNPDFYRVHGDIAAALATRSGRGKARPRCFAVTRTRVHLGYLGESVRGAGAVLCGADDDVSRRGSTPVGTAQRLAEALPGSELFLIPDTKHMTFWDGTAGCCVTAI